MRIILSETSHVNQCCPWQLSVCHLKLFCQHRIPSQLFKINCFFECMHLQDFFIPSLCVLLRCPGCDGQVQLSLHCLGKRYVQFNLVFVRVLALVKVKQQVLSAHNYGLSWKQHKCIEQYVCRLANSSNLRMNSRSSAVNLPASLAWGCAVTILVTLFYCAENGLGRVLWRTGPILGSVQ